jgi:monovalent cation:proton antiporter-2 (CPA2) family protein
MHGETLDFRQAIIFLFAAGIVVPLFRRAGISPVFGFLLAGLVIGPHGLARFAADLPWLHYLLIEDIKGVKALAELGVVFLLFMIGLELSMERLWSMRRRVFGLGGAQIMLTAVVISVIASFFENTLAAAVVLGFGFALSSTAIVMQLLTENRRLGTATGRMGFSILLCQDIAVLPILLLVGAFAVETAQSGLSIAIAFGQAIFEALVAMAAILLIGRIVIGPILRFYGGAANREMFIALVLLIVIGTAIATEYAGMSMALGAFLAGLLLAETEYRHAIEVDIEPFKGLLLGLFFLSIGMSIDVSAIFDNPIWLTASVIGLYCVKAPIIYGLARIFGENRSASIETGLLLGQGGEFGFIIVALAFNKGLLPEETAQFMLLVTGLSMALTPFIANTARKLAQLLESRERTEGIIEPELSPDLADHYILAGYGRIGQTIGALLDQQEIPHVGIDMNANLVSRFRSTGGGVFYGDARLPHMLKKLNLASAGGLIITVDNAQSAERIVETARRQCSEIPIYVRAKDRIHAEKLAELGASHIVRETVEASLHLGELVLTGIGIPEEPARRLIESRRELEYETDTQEKSGR